MAMVMVQRFYDIIQEKMVHPGYLIIRMKIILMGNHTIIEKSLEVIISMLFGNSTRDYAIVNIKKCNKVINNSIIKILCSCSLRDSGNIFYKG